MAAILVYLFNKDTCETICTRLLTKTETSMMCGDNLSLSPPHLKLQSRLKSGVLLLPMSKMLRFDLGHVFDDIYATALGIGSPKGSVLEAIYMASVWGFRPCVDALLHGLTKKIPEYVKQDPVKWLMLLLIICYTQQWAIDTIYLQMVCADICDLVNTTYGHVNFEYVLHHHSIVKRFYEVQKCAQKDDERLVLSDIDEFRSYVRNIISRVNGGLLFCSRSDMSRSASATTVSDVCSVCNDIVVNSPIS